MALQIPRYGMNALMREGGQYFTGVDEAVFQNIDACVELAKLTRSSYGPCGMNKLILNHLAKLFVTKDAATIVNETEVSHPAAALVCMAAQNQAVEMGDGTNYVMMFCGALLAKAKELITHGINQAEIVKGYNAAMAEVVKVLLTKEDIPESNIKAIPNFVVKDFTNALDVQRAIKSAIQAKCGTCDDDLFAAKTEAEIEGVRETETSSNPNKLLPTDSEPEIIVKLTAEAIMMVMGSSVVPGKKGSCCNTQAIDAVPLDIDRIRVAKVIGAPLSQSYVIDGMVLMRPPSSSRRELSPAQDEVCEGETKCQKGPYVVAVYNCPIDMDSGDTKTTILLHTASDLLAYNSGEEERIDNQIKLLREALGVSVVLTNQSISPLAQHYLDKYDMVSIRISSKFELMRFAKSVKATPMVEFGKIDLSSESEEQAETDEDKKNDLEAAKGGRVKKSYKSLADVKRCLGTLDSLRETELGGLRVTVVQASTECTKSRWTKSDSNTTLSEVVDSGVKAGISTIILRSSTRNKLDELEAAINNGINIIGVTSGYRNDEDDSVKDTEKPHPLSGVPTRLRFIPCLTTECILSSHIDWFAKRHSDIMQYPIQSFSDALLDSVKQVVDSSGCDGKEVMAALKAGVSEWEHHGPEVNLPMFDLPSGKVVELCMEQCEKHQVLAPVDSLSTKIHAMRCAVDVTCDVLKVGQVVLAKPSGGPDLRKRPHNSEFAGMGY